jgi:hypothetical protein
MNSLPFCSACDHTGCVPDPDFGGMMPCQCRDLPASVSRDVDLDETVAWTDLVLSDEAAA